MFSVSQIQKLKVNPPIESIVSKQKSFKKKRHHIPYTVRVRSHTSQKINVMGSKCSSRITESDVRSLFESKSKDCPTASTKSKIQDDEVSMVIVLHRHGARFPTKEMSSDLSWPSDDAFWDLYGANLTPVGSMQAYALGCSLHKRYANSKLFRGIETKHIGKHVKVQTSNKHRTLFTAWNLLRGMFPGVSSYFNYLGDRLELNMEDVETQMNKNGNRTITPQTRQLEVRVSFLTCFSRRVNSPPKV